MSADSIGKIADLLPCPFCGGPATFLADDSYETAHACCGPCEVGFISGSKTPEAAIAQWNRRALPSAELERDAGRYRTAKELGVELAIHGRGFGSEVTSYHAPEQWDEVLDGFARAKEARQSDKCSWCGGPNPCNCTDEDCAP